MRFVLIWLLWAVAGLSPVSATDVDSLTIEIIKDFTGAERLSPEMRHGFVRQLAIKHYLERFPEKSALLAPSLKKVTAPSRQNETISSSGRFVLHYDTDGYHAVPAADVANNGVPDFIDSAAVYLDHVWRVEIEELGFQPPLDVNGNPVTRYHIYFTNFTDQGLYGQTVFEDEIPVLSGENYTSYIELHHTFQGGTLYTFGLEAMKATIAHEFNHASQLGYRIWKQGFQFIDLFFIEASAVWLEEYVYGDVNDYYQYLPGLFEGIQRVPFTAANYPYLYGNGIFWLMAGQTLSPAVIPEIWEQVKQEPAFEAIGTVFKRHNTSFAEMQARYGQWLYFTGSRALEGLYYPEAADYPMLTIREDQHFTVVDTLTFRGTVGRRSLAYYSIDDLPSVRQRGQVRADGVLNSPAGLFNHLSPSDPRKSAVAISSAQIIAPTPGDTVAVLVTNPADTLQNIFYSLQSDTLIASSIGPNPVLLNEGVTTAWFYNVPEEANIFIYSLNGRRVKKLIRRGERDIAWDVRDENGRLLATGVYFYIIEAPQSRSRGKFAVIR